MARRLHWLAPRPALGLAFLAVSAGSCVIAENEGEATCGQSLASAHGGPCRCDADCADELSSCLSEAVTGVPTGMCSRYCFSDAECGAGFICESDYCFPTCTNSSECGRGRFCDGSADAERPVCFFLCDEDVDCDGGSCNPHSGHCEGKSERAGGSGVGEACNTHSECLSNMCFLDSCITRCDPASGVCPDGTECADYLCRLPCQLDRDCADFGAGYCISFDTGDYCL